MNVIEKYPEICKSAFIEHLTELQQKELFEILDKNFVRQKECGILLKLQGNKDVLDGLNDLNKYKQKLRDALKDIKKGAFLYKDTDGVTPDIVFSRGYNKALEELREKLKELKL